MDIRIQVLKLQELISKQKALAGISMWGAFREGYIAAMDIVNAWAKIQEPKCCECRVPLSERETMDGDICETCYGKLHREHNAEQNENK